MTNLLRYNFAKSMGKLVQKGFSIKNTGGRSASGYCFLKLGSQDALHMLSEKQLKIGAVLITGTNGKTTSTTMFKDLIGKDSFITFTEGNNTIYAIATSLLKSKSDLGIFEYGLRDIEHGIPDVIQKLLNPIGLVYTNISREHTQVLGVKNPFENYYKAKILLSENMKNGVIVTNADDPFTNLIGQNKEKDGHVNYYGLDVDIEDIFGAPIVKCPKCGKDLNYDHYFMNHRGLYHCDCGFKRSDLNVKINKLVQKDDRWDINITGDLYNYSLNENILFSVNINIPVSGLHNVYNVLTAITSYATFTPHPDNIKNNVESYFNNLTLDILPPGRFELVNVGNKIVGIGQGDNGDALKVNLLAMRLYTKEDLELIYTTPDTYEEEIFEDHIDAIYYLNPKHLIVLPGRKSVEMAKKYHDQIKKLDTEFYPIKYDFNDRINKILKLVKESKYKYILITGCGEEELFWGVLKTKLDKLN